MIVNNGASAVLLVLAAVARGRDVLVSRGEAVEIGGGFRVPEVMAESGARLVDVGTTNRTRLADYSRALARGDTDVALVLKVHPSNYRIEGFTEGVEVAELATLDVPVVVDIGSGLLDAACPWLKGGPPEWVRGERAARQTLEAGAAAVTFSGDKLLGGPQAGIIAGRREVVDACARHPLARALRAGGLTLAALQATALAYLSRDGDAIPFWRMATIPVGELRARAEAIDVGKVVETQAVAGAGSLPGTEIPSVGLAVPGDHTTALRAHDPAPDHRPRARRRHDLRPAHRRSDARCRARICTPSPGLTDATPPTRVIATAGHVDHGKSTLVLALTGTDPDRFEEEKRRGLTIDLGFAWTALPSGAHIAFVDVPGHVRFIKNMLAGVGSVDACLFVVAATEGWKPQSEEHLRILELLGIAHGVIALTQTDLVDPDHLELVKLDLAERVAGTFLGGAEVVGTAAPLDVGVDELRAALDRLVLSTPAAKTARVPGCGSTACSRRRERARS